MSTEYTFAPMNDARAACIGHARTMDGTTYEDVINALYLCADCPVLVACHLWAVAHTRRSSGGTRTANLAGVIGGKVYGEPHKKFRHQLRRRATKRAAA
jgi:hypothetical protein